MHHGTIVSHEARSLAITGGDVTANGGLTVSAIAGAVIETGLIILVTKIKEASTSERWSVLASANSVRPSRIEASAHVKETARRPRAGSLAAVDSRATVLAVGVMTTLVVISVTSACCVALVSTVMINRDISAITITGRSTRSTNYTIEGVACIHAAQTNAMPMITPATIGARPRTSALTTRRASASSAISVTRRRSSITLSGLARRRMSSAISAIIIASARHWRNER